MKKLFLGLLLSCSLLVINSVNVFADDTGCPQREVEDLNSIKNDEFEKIVETIVEFKTKFPEMSEEEIEIQIEKEKGISDIWNTLTPSEKKLVIRYPFAAIDVNKAKNIAIKQTESRFGENGLGNQSDAFRHGLWNAEMTILIGKDKAEMFATAHEDKDVSGVESDGYTKIEHRNMDLHNNEIGREMGRKNSSLGGSEMGNLIYDEIMKVDSKFMWLHD